MLLNYLVNGFKEKECVLFLGPELFKISEKVYPYSFMELTNFIKENAVGMKDVALDLENGDFFSTAQKVVWSSDGRQFLERLLIKYFESKKVPSQRYFNILSSLEDIIIITTNYDTLIESSFKYAGKEIHIILDDNDFLKVFKEIKSPSKTMLIKLFGCISKPSSCILTDNDLHTWLVKNSYLRDYIRSLFMLKKIVAVGYSLADPNFLRIIAELRKKLGWYIKPDFLITDKVEKNYTFYFLTKELGTSIIRMNPMYFLEWLGYSLAYGKLRYYYEIPEIVKKYNKVVGMLSFDEFAARELFALIKKSMAGPVVLNENVRRLIYRLSEKENFKYYRELPKVPAPEGMVWVPPGEFIMGGERHRNDIIRIVNVPRGYFIDKYPVTNKQYKEFLRWMDRHDDHSFCHSNEPLDKDHHPDPMPEYFNMPEDYFTNPKYDDYPVVCVDWWDAYAYARWAGKRLPTEIEWEKAARGIDGRLYPYGDIFSPEISNTVESKIGMPNKVGSRPKNVSPFGCYDMSGNVWEWCLDKFDERDMRPDAHRVVKGGSFGREYFRAKCSYRNERNPNDRWCTRGFRCVKDISKEEAYLFEE